MRTSRPCIDAASPVTRMQSEHVCVGNFHVSKSFTLVCKATPGIPNAVLSASGAGRVLLISARVTLADTKITHWPGVHRRRIYDDHGTVILKRVTVTGNAAHGGGGIFNRNGTVTFNDSVVSGNAGTGYPGRISPRDPHAERLVFRQAQHSPPVRRGDSTARTAPPL